MSLIQLLRLLSAHPLKIDCSAPFPAGPLPKYGPTCSLGSHWLPAVRELRADAASGI